jgi:hypothetical protein
MFGKRTLEVIGNHIGRSTLNHVTLNHVNHFTTFEQSHSRR